MFMYSFVLLLLLGLSNAQTEPSATEDSGPTDSETDAPTTDSPDTMAPSTSATTALPTTVAPSTEAPMTTAAPETEPSTTEPPVTTPPPPGSLSVECTNDEMLVILHHTKHPKLDLDKLTLKDPSCTFSDLGVLNSTHLSMKVPFDRCMTNHSTEDDTITYQNSLVTETRSSVGSILISREFQAEFPFKCSYPRSAVVSVASFSPRERIVYTKTAEFGNFSFTMDMYETDKYEKPFENFPVQLDLNDPMYLEVKVTANDSKLVLIPLKCWGTPSADLDDDKYYVFIENGCKKDDTLEFDYNESSVQRFELAAFRFMKEAPGSSVYLHCDVEACRKGDSESRCTQGCGENGKRERRSSLILDAVAQQSVTIGPITRRHSKVAQGQSSVSSLTVFAAVAGVLGVVVLTLIVALVMLYRRYRSPQNAPSVVYTKAANDEGKLLV